MIIQKIARSLMIIHKITASLMIIEKITTLHSRDTALLAKLLAST